MDINLGHSSVTSQLLRCMQVGLLCVQKFPSDRPAMTTVAFMLSYESMALPEPKEPGFFQENACEWRSREEYCRNNTMTITSLEARM